jgi:hypothetical protein
MADKSEVLQQLERGQITAAQAVEQLRGNGAAVAVLEPQIGDKETVVTRDERMGLLSGQLQAGEPHLLVAGLPGQEQMPWPWPENEWQWLWQDAFRPQHIDHSIELVGGDQVKAVFYEGDVRLLQADDGRLALGAAAFDLRLGQTGRQVCLAASGGSLDMALPVGIGEVEIGTVPGDLYVRDLSLQRLKAVCRSGVCRMEAVRGQVDIESFGSDVVLDGIEGDVRVRGVRAGVRAQGLNSARVDLDTDGDVQLDLGRIRAGQVRCLVSSGDVELKLAADSALDLRIEAPVGGVAPCKLAWSALNRRSPQGLEGSLGGGGASVEIVAQQGQVFIKSY